MSRITNIESQLLTSLATPTGRWMVNRIMAAILLLAALTLTLQYPALHHRSEIIAAGEHMM